jgi:hypothetical protein
MGIVTKIEPDGRLRFPEELEGEFAPDQEIEIVRCEEGVLVKPVRKLTLAEVLKKKIPMRNPLFLDLSDVNMDEYGW